MTYVYGSFWNNQGSDGDGSWAAPTDFGSSQWLFFEDNTWQNNDPTFTKGAIDTENSGRWVLRHNTINGCIPSNHGTESGGRGRGARRWTFTITRSQVTSTEPLAAREAVQS
jgi:hypothetical protein